MRIAVANVTGGGLSGGYRKYLGRLMPLLAGDSRVARLTVFVPRTGNVPMPGVDVRLYEPGGGFRALVGDVGSLQPDVVFIPTARWVRFGAVPVVTMVRNMEPLTPSIRGNTWTERARNVARRWEAKRAALKARRVIAVSQHVRGYIVNHWSVDPDRVGVVYHGVDREARVGNADRRVVLTAGSIRPARGLEDLVRALPWLEPDVEVVIAGAVDRGAEHYAAALRLLAHRSGRSHQVTWAGQLTEDQMRAAFGRAAVFVMTSRAEACPNTVLEAMSAGCPSVSVDLRPMPEFFRDAAVYYPAGDAPQLARQLSRLLADSEERQRLGDLATARAGDFTWESTRDRTIAELQGAMS